MLLMRSIFAENFFPMHTYCYMPYTILLHHHIHYLDLDVYINNIFSDLSCIDGSFHNAYVISVKNLVQVWDFSSAKEIHNFTKWVIVLFGKKMKKRPSRSDLKFADTNMNLSFVFMALLCSLYCALPCTCWSANELSKKKAKELVYSVFWTQLVFTEVPVISPVLWVINFQLSSETIWLNH